MCCLCWVVRSYGGVRQSKRSMSAEFAIRTADIHLSIGSTRRANALLGGDVAAGLHVEGLQARRRRGVLAAVRPRRLSIILGGPRQFELYVKLTTRCEKDADRGPLLGPRDIT